MVAVSYPNVSLDEFEFLFNNSLDYEMSFEYLGENDNSYWSNLVQKVPEFSGKDMHILIPKVDLTTGLILNHAHRPSFSGLGNYFDSEGSAHSSESTFCFLCHYASTLLKYFCFLKEFQKNGIPKGYLRKLVHFSVIMKN